MKNLLTLTAALLILVLFSFPAQALTITGTQFQNGVSYEIYYQQVIDGISPDAWLEDGYLDGTLGGTGWTIEDPTKTARISMWYTANETEALMFENIGLSFTEFAEFYWAPADIMFVGIDVSEITQFRAIVTQGDLWAEDIIERFDGNSPVPEPATIFLFGIGLLGLAGIKRKNPFNY